MPTKRGGVQRRPLSPRADPEELVAFTIRVPDRLRTKLRAVAGAANMSAAAYMEQLLEQLPGPAALPDSLPLAESA